MMTTDERIQAYLDGTLPADEAAVFERELTDPEVSRRFGEELFLRELMRDMGPEVPEGLAERLAAALPLAAAEPEGERLPRLRAALDGVGWAVRGPAMAFSAGPGVVGGREAISGVRTALGVTAPEPAVPAARAKPLWRRALRGLVGARETASNVARARERLSGVGETLSDVGAAVRPAARRAQRPLWRRVVGWVRR